MINAPGWLTSHIRTPYPFVGPETPKELEDTDFRTLFVDASIRYTALVPFGEEGAREEQLRLKRFDYDGSALGSESSESGGSDTGSDLFQINLVWGEEEAFFDSLNPGPGNLIFSYSQWGIWVILEWIYLRDIDVSGDFDKIVRVILDARKLNVFAFPIKPDDAYLVPGVIVQSSSKVTTLRFINHSGSESILPDPDAISPSGDIYLAAGYNVDLALAEDPIAFTLEPTVEVRPATRVALDFTPGAGRGLYPGCVESTGGSAIRRLNSVDPDINGHFQLGAEGCYWWERLLDEDTGSIEEATLRLNNWCMPCCSCDSYVDSYDKLSEVWETLNETLEDYIIVRDEITSVISAFESGSPVECGRVIPHIISYMKHSWLLTGQAILYNATGKTLYGFTIDFQLTSSLPYTYVSNSAWISTPEEDRRISDAAGYAQQIILKEPVRDGTAVIFEYEVYFTEYAERISGASVSWTLSGSMGTAPDKYLFFTTAIDWLQPPFNH